MNKNYQHSTTMADKLRKAGAVAKHPTLTTGLPANPNLWDGEGVDHINVASNAKTELGKALNWSTRRRKTILHPVMGKFSSAWALWEFIRSAAPSDEIRNMSNTKEIKDTVIQSGGYEDPEVANAKAVVFHVLYMNILTDENLYVLLKKNELPFDMYSAGNSMMPSRFRTADWMIHGFTEINDAIKEDRLPDFFLLTDPDWRQANKITRENFTVKRVYDGIITKFAIDKEKFDKINFEDWCQKKIDAMNGELYRKGQQRADVDEPDENEEDQVAARAAAQTILDEVAAEADDEQSAIPADVVIYQGGEADEALPEAAPVEAEAVVQDTAEAPSVEPID